MLTIPVSTTVSTENNVTRKLHQLARLCNAIRVELVQVATREIDGAAIPVAVRNSSRWETRDGCSKVDRSVVAKVKGAQLPTAVSSKSFRHISIPIPRVHHSKGEGKATVCWHPCSRGRIQRLPAGLLRRSLNVNKSRQVRMSSILQQLRTNLDQSTW